MNVTAFFAEPWVERLAWSLVHFVWEGAAFASFLVVALALARRRSAGFRYVMACLTLGAMALAPLATFAILGSDFRQLERAPVAIESVGVQPESTLSAQPTSDASISPQTSSIAVASWRASITEGLRPWMAWIVTAWVAGVLLLSIRLVGGWIAVQALRSKDLFPAHEPAAAMFQGMLARMRLLRRVRLFESARVVVPITLGWLRPVVLLPASALTGLTPAQLEAILAHELAHVRRHDYFVNALQSIIETLLFYHPAVWWVSARIRAEREHCCDDAAVVTCGDRIGYARALTRLEELRAHVPALALSSTGGSLLHRIRRLLVAPVRHERDASAWFAGLAGFVVLIGLAVFGVAKGEEEAANAHWKATLPGGLTIELVGISDYPEGASWWRPDGSPLPEAPRGVSAVKRPSPPVPANAKRFQFAIRIRRLPELQTRVSALEASATSWTTDETIRPGSPRSDAPFDELGVLNAAFRTKTISRPIRLPDGKTVFTKQEEIPKLGPSTIRYDAAVGPWITEFAHSAGNASSETAHIGTGGDVILKKIDPDKQPLLVSVAHSYTRPYDDEAVRLVAIKADGAAVVVGRKVGGLHSGRVETADYEFDLRLDEIKEFQFQTCRSERVEFRNVSLYPDERTEVEIKIGRP